MVKYFVIFLSQTFSPKTALRLKSLWVYIITGYISVKTTVLANDTVVARMSKMVEEASSRKSRAQRFIDNFSKYYIPGKYQVHRQTFLFEEMGKKSSLIVKFTFSVILRLLNMFASIFVLWQWLP